MDAFYFLMFYIFFYNLRFGEDKFKTLLRMTVIHEEFLQKMILSGEILRARKFLSRH